MAQTNKNSLAKGSDILLLPDGTTYHLGVQGSHVYQRVLTVGSESRARSISTLLDSIEYTNTSNRGYTVISGKYHGVGVTIIAIGMGAPMMDFMVRELFVIQPKPTAIVRFGTCGLLDKDIIPGTVVTAGKGAAYIQTNYSHFSGEKDKEPYLIAQPVPCNSELNALVSQCIKDEGLNTVDGLNSSAELFFSCQGRHLDGFDDSNSHMLKKIQGLNAISMEMETHQLFHLASIRSKDAPPLHVAAAAVGIVNRDRDALISEGKLPDDGKNVLSKDQLVSLELKGGKAVLEALIKFKF